MDTDAVADEAPQELTVGFLTPVPIGKIPSEMLL
jgi:hypothetical protein